MSFDLFLVRDLFLLFCSRQSGDAAAVNMLLERKADINVTNKEELKPIDLAMGARLFTIVGMLKVRTDQSSDSARARTVNLN